MDDKIRDCGRFIVRWVTTPGPLMLFSLIVVGLGFGLPFWFADPPKDYVLVMAAAAAVGGFLFTASANFHAHARDRAFVFIEAYRKDKELHDAFRNVAPHFINPEDPIDLAYLLKLNKSDIETDIKLVEDMELIGTFFEDMATEILYKEINGDILEAYFDGVLVRYYDLFKKNDVLRFWINDPPIEGSPYGNTTRPEILVNMKKLYGSWEPRYWKRYENRDSPDDSLGCRTSVTQRAPDVEPDLNPDR